MYVWFSVLSTVCKVDLSSVALWWSPLGRLNVGKARNVRSLDQHQALVSTVSICCSCSKLGYGWLVISEFIILQIRKLCYSKSYNWSFRRYSPGAGANRLRAGFWDFSLPFRACLRTNTYLVSCSSFQWRRKEWFCTDIQQKICLLNINHYYKPLLQQWQWCSHHQRQHFSFPHRNKPLLIRNSFLLGQNQQHTMGFCRNNTALKLYFIHLFHRGGWRHAASVGTAAASHRKRCLCGIPAGLQGGPRPCSTIWWIISAGVPDPRREEMTHNHAWGCAGGKRSPEHGWVPAWGGEVRTAALRLPPLFFLQVKQRWYQLRGAPRWKSP